MVFGMNSSVLQYLKSKERITVYLLSTLLFTEPRVLYRVLLQTDAVAIAVIGIILFMMLSQVSKVGQYLQMFSERAFIFYVVFFLCTIIIRFHAGVPLEYIVQYFPLVFYGSFIYVYTKSNLSSKILVEGLAFCMCLHAASILLPFDFIKEALAHQTAYGYSGDDLIGSRRATGFFASPGYLSLYAAVGFGIGFTLYIYEKKPVWLVLFLASLVCGFATVNRSFIIALGVYLLFLPWFLELSFKKMLGFMIPLLLLIGAAVYVAEYTSYFDLIEERFSGNLLDSQQNDRLGGETGILEVMKAIQNYPLAGNMQVKPNDGGVFVWNGTMFVRPHNSILGTLANYGVFIGSIFLILVIVSTRNLVKKYPFEYDRPLRKAFLAGLILCNVVCLVEPLYETAICLLVVFYGINYVYNLKMQYGRSLSLSTGAG
jgi:hypothetical protein